jgi:hypothetical protein
MNWKGFGRSRHNGNSNPAIILEGLGEITKNSIRIFCVQGEAGCKHLSNTISNTTATSLNLQIFVENIMHRYLAA